MADTRIPMDQRNPFAAWGIEEVKYGVKASEDGSIVALKNKGFEGQLTEDNMYNKVVVNNSYEANPQESFFTNNDTQKYDTPVTHAYGFDKDKQPEREAGEPLNYYGIQADDLKKYDEDVESEEGDENETPAPTTNTTEPTTPVTNEDPTEPETPSTSNPE